VVRVRFQFPRRSVHNLLGHTAYRRSSPGGMRDSSILDGPGQLDEAEAIARRDHVFHAVTSTPAGRAVWDQ